MDRELGLSKPAPSALLTTRELFMSAACTTAKALLLAASTFDPLTSLCLLVFVLIYLGVILPTVWSRHPDRRSAARRTLETLVGALRKAGRR
ncbi:hypothetical protein AB0K43_16580 [Kitasatospora sp. NPDC049258]|uniref:hypothetical protein n=1 Tax=Kitasatospora sp. NPDC049258 TaxID=3155394 RepID=UPI00343705D4